MSKPIFQVIDDLPARNMTTRLLGAMDWVVPGEYKNVVGFENTIREVTGETDQAWIQKIGERAIQLYNDKSQGYQRSLWLYQTVDTIQGGAGAIALANKLSETFSFLSFLDRLTPKADTTQAIDLGLKVAVEIGSFCLLNGIPGDSIGDFVKSLSDYRHEALMRMATMVCIDGLIPLGPDFVDKGLSLLDRTGATGLANNSRFKQIQSLLPGNSVTEKLGFVTEGLGSVKGWMGSFVDQHGLTVDRVVSNLRGAMQGIDGKLDYVAAFLDMTSNYVEHTGTQTVARSLVSRAAGEI